MVLVLRPVSSLDTFDLLFVMGLHGIIVEKGNQDLHLSSFTVNIFSYLQQYCSTPHWIDACKIDEAGKSLIISKSLTLLLHSDQSNTTSNTTNN
jgi:hypothetical protein